MNVKDRALSDWDGVWKSVNPHLLSGDLAAVLEKKAKTSGKSLAEYRAYYQKGYATNVETIGIENNVIEFQVGKELQAADTTMPDTKS